jgi:Ca2+-binding RTX toxin-like protein
MKAIDTSITFDGGAGTDTLTMDSSLDLTGQTFSMTGVEIIDIDLAVDAASTLTVDSSQVTGNSFSVIATEGTTNDILDVTVNGATVDLSGISVETADVTVTVDGTAYTAANSTTVTGTNGVDTININGGTGSTANGGGSGDTITGGAGADTINGDGGGDTLNGGGGADTITGGEGGDTITAGNGSDTINLAEATAATDVIVTTSTLTSADTINDFKAGSSGTADNVEIDLSDVEALATNLADWDDGNTDVAAAGGSGAGTAATLSTVTGAFDAENLTTGTDILVLGGSLTFSSVGAVADALEAGGSAEFTVDGSTATDTAGDIYMVLYSDGTNSHLAAVETSVAAGDNGTYAAGELTGNLILTFNGIADATDFASANFDFIT